MSRAGTVTLDGHRKGHHVVTYYWGNPNGSGTNLVFRDDKLVLKMQIGLK